MPWGKIIAFIYIYIYIFASLFLENCKSNWYMISSIPNKWNSFFQAAVVSIQLYGFTTWTLTKRLEKKIDGNYTRMLRAILNKSWQQHPTKHKLYSHLPPITKTIQVRWARHAGHCWRSRDELISDVLLWTPTYGRAKVGQPARTYIQQLCEDTGISPEDLPEAMNDREKCRERVRDIRASGSTWWWWWFLIQMYCFKYSYLIQIIRMPLYSFMYFYLIIELYEFNKYYIFKYYHLFPSSYMVSSNKW